MDFRVRGFLASDVVEADRVFRLAFGTFMGMPDPLSFAGDTDFIRTRWKADPSLAFVADSGGVPIGSNFAARWGSFGFFGPLSVHPDHWEHGVGKALLAPVMDLFGTWALPQTALYTFSNSPKHLALYHKYGYRPRYLIAVLSRRFAETPENTGGGAAVRRYSGVEPEQRRDYLKECAAIADAIHPGLDLKSEILAVREQNLGDTILLPEERAFAVCHCGAGTEAGGGSCYVKFGGAAPGEKIEERFDRLIEAAEDLARSKGLVRVVAGISTARSRAYARMLEQGWRISLQGVAMHRPDAPAHCHADAFVMDDWR